MKNGKRLGFTVVELLIVIVVIGILAAVTLVSYNGIRDRALDSSNLSLVTQYESALKIYYARNGKFPAVSGADDTVCLGLSYPADADFEEGKCFLLRSTGAAEWHDQAGHIDVAFMNSLNSIAKVSQPQLAVSGVRGVSEGSKVEYLARGIRLYVDTHGAVNEYKLFYGIQGNACPSGDVALVEYENLEDGAVASGNICQRTLKL